MQQIKKFDPINLKQLHVIMQEALNKIAADFDLHSISLGIISYDPEGICFSSKVVARTKAENNSAVAEMQKRDSQYLGYDNNIIGSVAVIHGIKYRIDELNMKRRKFPIVATNLETNKQVGLRAGVPIEGITYDRTKLFFVK